MKSLASPSEREFDMRDQTVRKRVIYHGRVQGVGFRATTCDIASRFDVTGVVRNLPDGTVELIVDARPSEVERFLAAVADRFSRNITKADVASIAADNPFSTFEVGK